MSGKMQEIYDTAVASGALNADPAQFVVLQVLEDIREQLERSAAPRGLRGLFAKTGDAPKGLYLWGGVGRGKSMLMDMFVGAGDVP